VSCVALRYVSGYDDDDDNNNNNNTAMGSVHARGDTFLTFGLKALTETNTSRLATGFSLCTMVFPAIKFFSTNLDFELP
jgi:hypothetical protein